DQMAGEELQRLLPARPTGQPAADPEGSHERGAEPLGLHERRHAQRYERNGDDPQHAARGDAAAVAPERWPQRMGVLPRLASERGAAHGQLIFTTGPTISVIPSPLTLVFAPDRVAPAASR